MFISGTLRISEDENGGDIQDETHGYIILLWLILSGMGVMN